MKFQVQELLDCALRYYKPLNLNSVKNNKPWTIVNRSASQKHQNRDDTIRLIEEFKNSIEKAHPALEHFGNYELDKRISMLNQWCQGLTMMDSEQAKPCEACGLPV
ncbi:uncharacterized protein L201_002377 [Kwoniella dendrophila CBS 6074]|uniref:Uncharacterized protein n=1 Tax=Kwoniella dendrophila CBS 6074 TaxID=1295534 RepID=A0AAX4JQ00_9TREE